MSLEVLVETGLAGCRLAVERRAVAVVVDALRASATITSLFHYGAECVAVVKDVSEAFAERARRPGAALLGERGGPMVPGFDLGNSPLQAPPTRDIRQVVFSSSNCSRCCVAAAGAAVTFLGTTVNASAVARAVRLAAGEPPGQEVVLIPAGAAEDETRLTLEDHLACGAIIWALERGLGEAQPLRGNDRAEVCRRLFGVGEEADLRESFCASDNGRRLTRLGLGADVEFAARLDVFEAVPRLVALEGPAAVFGPWPR